MDYRQKTTNSEYKKYALEDQGVYYDKNGVKTKVSVTSEDIYEDVSTLTYNNVYNNRNYYAKDVSGQYHRLGISGRWVGGFGGHYAYYLTVDGTETGEEISWDKWNAQIQLDGYTFHQYRTTRYTYKDIAANTTILTSDGANSRPQLNGKTATFYYFTQQTQDQTKLTALKAAAKQFIANVAAQELPEGKTHRISIVKFSGIEAISIGNDTYTENGNRWNWTQTVVSLTNVTGDSVKTLEDKVDALQAAGGTLANNGMSRAKAVLDSRTAEEKSRPSVVIMFTDGVPTKTDTFNDEVAAGAINNAKSLKDSGTTVYTIAVANGAKPEDTPSGNTIEDNINWYLNAVSSNYPNASATKTGSGWNEKWTFNYGTRVSAEKDYYFTATDAQGLSMVFDTISREVSNLALIVDSTAVLSDTLSGFFTFDGVDAADTTGITVEEVPVKGTDANGNFTWDTDKAKDITKEVKIAVSGKSITVEGFNYGEKAVTKHQDGKVAGSKLVITFPIKPDDTATWTEGNYAYPTNDTTNSPAGLTNYALKSDPDKKDQNTLLTQSPTLAIEAHKVTYVVEANGYAGTYTIPAVEFYRTGVEYTIADPLTPAAGSGYTFTGWCTDNTYATPASGTNPMGTANVTLYGKFTKSTYQVDLSNYIKKTLFADSLPEDYSETFTATVVVDGDASGELNITTPAFTVSDFAGDVKSVTKRFNDCNVNLSVGEHTFTVTETTGSNTHIVYDTTPKTFALQVAANDDVTYGTMENGDFVAATGTEQQYVNIQNRYTPDTVSFDLTGKFQKVLNSQDDISGLTTAQKTFTLTITKAGETTSTATGTAAVANKGEAVNFDFGSSTLTFSATGDYTYTVQERNDRVSGMSYDTEVTLTVTVADKNGKLEISSAKVTGSGIEETSVLGSNESFTVINTYTKPGVTVVKKTVTGRVNDSEIQNKLDEAGIRYPEYVSSKNKCELTVDKNIDSVTLAYEVTITGEAGAQANVSDTNASYIGGTADEGVTVATDGKTVTFNQEGTAKLYYTMKFDRNTEGTFDNAKNTVIVNGNSTESEETSITDVDPTGFDFSNAIQKKLTVTGSKPFTGATFEATLTLTDFEEQTVRPTALFAAPAEVEESHEEAWGKGTYYKLYATYDSSDKDGGWKNFLTSDGKHLILDFPADGIYTFRLEETNKTFAGVTYDDVVYTIKVYVSGDGLPLAVNEITVVYEYDGEEIIDWIFRKSGSTTYTSSIAFYNTIDTGKDDYIPIIIPTIVGKDTGMLNKTDHFAYVIGYPDGTVHPNGQITRAEVATIFFRLLKDEVRDGAFTTSNSYSDVAYGKWYNNPISTMSALGIITGYPDGTFKPDKPITRAEFAAIAARFDETQYGKSATFSDVIGHWAANEIGIAYANEWIKGYPDGTFKPDQNITRAEAMTMINRVLERQPESPSDLLTDMNKWTDNMDTSKWYYLDVQEATNSHAYTRKTFNYELWRQMLTDPDWSRYER